MPECGICKCETQYPPPIEMLDCGGHCLKCMAENGDEACSVMLEYPVGSTAYYVGTGLKFPGHTMPPFNCELTVEGYKESSIGIALIFTWTSREVHNGEDWDIIVAGICLLENISKTKLEEK